MLEAFRRRKSRTAPVPLADPLDPTAAVRALQRESARDALSPVTAWILRGGWAVIAVPAVVLLLGALALGPSLAGELLLGLATPADLGGGWYRVTIGWLTAITGWSVIPALIGAVAGYVFARTLDRYRPLTEDEIMDQVDGEG